MIDFLNSIDNENRKKIEPIFKYIEDNYKQAVFSMDYAPKTKMPTYKLDNNYVTIGLMKNYISIHFSNYSAVRFLVDNWKIKGNVGCVNIPYKLDMEFELIFHAVDLTFGEKEMS